MRLDKMLCDNLKYSRSEIKKIIKGGKVAVNNTVILNPDFSVNYGEDITVFGEKVTTEQFIYLKMNKPAGVLTATRDKQKTVLDLLPDDFYKKDLFPVGRLDKDTTGLLILTNNGELAHKLLAPKSHVEKTYFVTLDDIIPQNLEKEFAKSLVLSDGTKLKPSKLKILSDYTAEIILTEGKYHQIKRMFGLFNLGVVNLKRISFGGIALNNLKEGSATPLTNPEIQMLLDKM